MRKHILYYFLYKLLNLNNASTIDEMREILKYIVEYFNYSFEIELKN